MKTLFIAIAFLAGTTAVSAGSLPNVNEKVLKLFQETFKDPKDVVWKEYDAFYEVNFKLNDIQFTVRYDTNGNVLRYLRYYSENQLPVHILSTIKKKYPERSIYGITEYFNGSDLSYFVIMQDNTHWYRVKSDSVGNLEQTEKFTKAESK